MTLWRRLRRPRALERELDAELRDHIEREVAEGVRGGRSEADVRRQIRLTSGGLDQVKEVCRDVRRPAVLADLGADVRFAWRILARNGWATAGAILTLALAMAVANTTFSAWVIFAGVILGVPTALVVGRLLQNTLVRTEARDIVTLIVTVVVLAAVALVASVVPAQRATRLEATTALRIE